MPNTTRQTINTVLFSTGINGASLLSGAWGWDVQFWITGLLFLVAGSLHGTQLLIKHTLIFSLILLFPFAVIYTTFTLWISAIHVYPIAFIPFVLFPAGLFLSKQKGLRKAVFLLWVTVLLIIIGMAGIPNWLAYIFNPSAEAAQVELAGITFTDMNGNTIDPGSLKGRVIVLDIWGTHCAVCYKKFPEFEELVRRYGDQVVFYAVHLLASGEQPWEAQRIIEKQQYAISFAQTDSLQAERIRNTLLINSIPTLVIVNKGGKVVYKGGMITDREVFVNNANILIQDQMNQSD